MHPCKSHLQLRVLVNGEEISDVDSVGDDWGEEVREGAVDPIPVDRVELTANCLPLAESQSFIWPFIKPKPNRLLVVHKQQ
jgi:hypothetical protein